MLLSLLMFVILVACVASLYTEGMWGNAVRLVNVIIAALLATNFFEPVSRLLEGSLGDSYTYFYDFLALWGLFVALMVVFRTLTDVVSRVKVRFLKLADRVGSVVFSLWIGWVLVCFSMMSLHTAPLGRNFMGGNFDPQNPAMFFGLAGPDRQWLGFMQRMSRGAFCRYATAEELQQNRYGTDPNPAEQPLAVFDRRAEFIPKYATRRANLEANALATGSFRIIPGSGVAR